jgi:hypothetical protein
LNYDALEPLPDSTNDAAPSIESVTDIPREAAASKHTVAVPAPQEQAAEKIIFKETSVPFPERVIVNATEARLANNAYVENIVSFPTRSHESARQYTNAIETLRTASNAFVPVSEDVVVPFRNRRDRELNGIRLVRAA